MADSPKVIKLRDTADQAAYILSCTSDGSGESAVQKIDISAIKMAATKVRIKKLIWGISGQMTVELLFDHNTDDSAGILAGSGRMQEDDTAAIFDPASAGGTGDILLTSKVTTATVGQGYWIYIEIAKVA
jgi:hypothetical protein